MAARATVEIVAFLRDAVTGPLKGIGASIRSTFSGIRGLVTSALGAGFLAAVKNVADTETAILRLARTTRSSVEDVSALKFALDDLGIGSNNLKELLNQLEGKRSDALRGGGQARSAFGRLGVEIAELRTLGGVDILRQLGDAYLQAGRSADSAAQLQAIFGDRFREFLPLLEQGSDGFDKLRRRADALGATISSSDAQKAEQFTKAWTELTTVAGGLFRDLANEILPALTKAVRELRNLLSDSGFRRHLTERLAESVERIRGDRAVHVTDEELEVFKQLGAQFEKVGAFQVKFFNPDQIQANAKAALAQIQREADESPIRLSFSIQNVEKPNEFLAGFRAKVESTKAELEDLFKFGQHVAEETSDILVSNTSKALDAIRNQTAKTRDALRELIDGLIEDFTRLAQNELLKRLFNSLLGLVSGAAGAGATAGAGGGAGNEFGSGSGFGLGGWGMGGTLGAGGGRLIGSGSGNKRLGGNLFGGPQGFGGGGTTINLSSNSTAEEQRDLVSAIMRHEATRNRQVRVAMKIV